LIISASRRTDIPSHYSEWFYRRLKKGFVEITNPYNRKIRKNISLKLSDVDLIVFWTKNASPLIKYLSEIDDMGYKYFFHYTINNYPANIEPKTPELHKTIETLEYLNEKIGKSRIIWRYDPIFFSADTNIGFHQKNFEYLLKKIGPKTDHLIFSFFDHYPKAMKRIKEKEVSFFNGTEKELFELKKQMVLFIEDITKQFGMKAYTCCEEVSDISNKNISNRGCINEEFIKRTFNFEFKGIKDKGQRKLCNCIKSIDIGAYNTCINNCIYCYAVSNFNTAEKKYIKMDTGSIGMIENKYGQLNLFG